MLQARGLAHVEGLGEPDQQLVRPGHHHLEVLGGVDEISLFAVGQQGFQGGRHVLEHHAHVGVGRLAWAGPKPSPSELDDPADAAVLETDPGNEVTLPQPVAEGRDAAGRVVEHLGQSKQDDLENLSFHARSDGLTVAPGTKERSAKSDESGQRPGKAGPHCSRVSRPIDEHCALPVADDASPGRRSASFCSGRGREDARAKTCGRLLAIAASIPRPLDKYSGPCGKGP